MVLYTSSHGTVLNAREVRLISLPGEVKATETAGFFQMVNHAMLMLR
jgi:hypothetical protein